MATVSVVMAVYNGERYLRAAVDSILSQTLTDFEFVIVEDGSTDQTRDILRSYDDPRIRLVENGGNLGLTRSLNRGLQAARGEFVARQDADDISEAQRLERQVAFLDAHPEVALLGSWVSSIDAHGGYCGQHQLPCEHQELRWNLFFANHFVHGTVMLRREPVLREVGLYDESYTYAQDFELWCRIADRFRVANLSEFLVRYRHHAASMTSTISDANAEAVRLQLVRIRPRLGWEERNPVECETRRAALTALYFGWEVGVEPESLLRAVDDLLHLHAAFCAEEKLERGEADRERAALRARIARYLVLLARTSSSADLAQRRELLRRAYRLHRSVYVQPRVLLRTGIALVKGVLPQASSRHAGAAAPD